MPEYASVKNYQPKLIKWAAYFKTVIRELISLMKCAGRFKEFS